jgi:hypothetical protein
MEVGIGRPTEPRFIPFVSPALANTLGDFAHLPKNQVFHGRPVSSTQSEQLPDSRFLTAGSLE